MLRIVSGGYTRRIQRAAIGSITNEYRYLLGISASESGDFKVMKSSLKFML